MGLARGVDEKSSHRFFAIGEMFVGGHAGMWNFESQLLAIHVKVEGFSSTPLRHLP